MENGELNPKTKQLALAYLAAFFTTLLWAMAFPATRYALQYYSPESIMVLRFVTASIALIIVGIIKKIRLPKPKDIPLFVATGLCGISLYSYLFNTGSQTVISGVGSFIIASAPVFTLILSRIILKEKVTKISWIGVFVSFFGLALVTLLQITDFEFNIGVILLIICAVLFGLYNIVVRKLTQSYTPLEITVYSILSGTIANTIFTPHFVREVADSNLIVNLVVIFMGVVISSVGFLTWSYALAKAEKVAHITVFAYLIPFMAAIIAYFWLDETLNIYTFIGGIIIIVGMLMTNLFGKRRIENDDGNR